MRTRRTPRKTATKWLWFNGSFELLRLLRAPFVRVRYEDLVGDPVTQLRICAAHADLELAEDDLAFIGNGSAELGAGHLVAGNRMRHLVGTIELRMDQAWREGLSESDRRVVELVTSPLRRRYGYA